MSDSPPVKIEVFDAKPNPMFSPELTAVTKFLRYEKAVPCAFCGRKSRYHWTTLIKFKAGEMGPFAIRWSETAFEPMTPVCRGHLMTIVEKTIDLPLPTRGEVE